MRPRGSGEAGLFLNHGALLGLEALGARATGEHLPGDLVASAARIVEVLDLAADAATLRLGAARVLGGTSLDHDAVGERVRLGNGLAEMTAVHVEF